MLPDGDKGEIPKADLDQLKEIFVTQKEHGDLKTSIAEEFGEIKSELGKVKTRGNSNFQLLILIASSVIVDILLTIGRLFSH